MRRNSLLVLVIAVIFGFLAVGAVQSYLNQQKAAFLNAGNGVEGTIVVAAIAMRFGALIEAGNLKEIPWAAQRIPPGAYRQISEVVSEEGRRYALGAIAPDEPILRSKITAPGQRATLSTTLTEGKRAATIRVNDVLGVAGFVLPGDKVDVMLTRSRRGQGGADEPYVDVLLQGVRVLAIDQLADEQHTDRPSVVKSVTFEVDTEEAQKLALGSQVGTLSLALRYAGAEQVERVRRITVTDLDTNNSEAERLRAQLSAAEAERLAAETAREEALRRVEEMFRDAKGDMTPEMLNAEIEKQIKLMEERIRAEMAEKPAPAANPGSTRIGVSRGAARTEYTVRN